MRAIVQFEVLVDDFVGSDGGREKKKKNKKVVLMLADECADAGVVAV
jgi:hypothetical protein